MNLPPARPVRAPQPSASLHQAPLAGQVLTSIRENTAKIINIAAADHTQLLRHINFQTVLAELAADLVDSRVEDLDQGVCRTLQRIASFGGDQRGWLSAIDDDGHWHTACEWHEEGLAPLAAEVTKAVEASTPLWTLAKLSAGEPVHVGSSSDLPPEADSEHRLREQFGIRSAIILPILNSESALLGAALFLSHDREGDWPYDFAPVREVVCDMLRAALLRQREHSRLVRSEARLRGLRGAGMLGILTAHRDGRIVDANDAALMVTGHDHTAVAAGQMRWDKMTPSEYRHMTTAAMDQFERAGHCPPWEQDFYRRDGSRVAVLLGLAAVQDSPGTFLVFALDVSARKRSEHELTERNRLTRLITLLSTRFIGIDPEHIDVAIEDALREIAEVIELDRCSAWQFLPGGDNQAELTHRWDRSDRTTADSRPRRIQLSTMGRWDAAFAKRDFILIRDGGSDLLEDFPERRYPEERGVRSALALPLLRRRKAIGFITFVSGRSDEQWYESRVALLRIVGEVIGAALERRHIWQRRRLVHSELEKRFTARTSQIEAANRELEAFSHTVSHDLRAPLRGIDGFSRILAEDHAAGLSAPARAVLERIRGTCQRMDGLINALLTLSRIMRSQPKRKTVFLTAMAAAICESLRESDPDRRVTFVLEPAMIVDGEPRLLRVLLDNLLRNSWKFSSTRDKTRIELGSFQDGNGRVFYVRDDGVGFDPSQAETLFEPFRRLHTPGIFEGYGVGLATVQRIVSVHGGRVWAEGRPGQGATIYFTLDPTVEDRPDPGDADQLV